MSRSESYFREHKPNVFEGGSIFGALVVEEPETFEEGLVEGALTKGADMQMQWQWEDDNQPSLFRPGANPKAVELAEVNFTRSMTVQDVQEWLQKYNVRARLYNEQHGFTANDPLAMPTYILANRFQLLAWRRGTKGEVTQEHGKGHGKFMVAGGSSTVVLGSCVLYFSSADDRRELFLFRKNNKWSELYSFLLVRTA